MPAVPASHPALILQGSREGRSWHLGARRDGSNSWLSRFGFCLVFKCKNEDPIIREATTSKEFTLCAALCQMPFLLLDPGQRGPHSGLSPSVSLLHWVRNSQDHRVPTQRGALPTPTVAWDP